MRYVDTNILVRVITGDNRALAEEAIIAIESSAQNEICIVDAILVELCFVLEFHDYAMSREDIAGAIRSLIATPQIFVSDSTLTALSLYEKHPKLDYADCLLFALGGRDGIITYDKDLQKILLS